MVYNPATDFLALWRASGGNVSKLEMPGLDYVISALARAGIITLSVSATAPVANQSTTAWLQAAVPSFSAEGVFRLWDADASAYAAATPALLLQFLEACAGQNGVSWWASTGGAPSNTVGNDGDFAIRTDEPGGIYGPKALGAWPPDPIPGTVDTITSTSLDNAFGNTPGQIIIRGAVNWEALPVGSADEVLSVAGGLPSWAALSALLDTVFGNVQGSIFYRAAAAWDALPPGTAGEVLSTGGAGADPAWASKTPEFSSGTRLVFHMAAAPVGWTQDITVNDYGLRVVATAGGGVVAGSAFSTVFAQLNTGGHVLTEAELAPHAHGYFAPNGTSSTGGGAFPIGGAPIALVSDTAGGGAAHTHPINLTLAYTDVIIAEKD